MYFTQKIPAPFCGRPCKNTVSAQPAPPPKPVRKEPEPEPIQAEPVPIKAAEEKKLPRKSVKHNISPLLIFLLLGCLSCSDKKG